jgi:hypothetical protein
VHVKDCGGKLVLKNFSGVLPEMVETAKRGYEGQSQGACQLWSA